MDLFTQQTLNFVLQHIDPQGLRILEVGCGTGEFGIQLAKNGAELIALDSDRDAVESAKRNGLNAHCIDFLSYTEDPFDAIIFTRSLHHIHELDEALKHAKSLLKPQGKVLMEEFDLENVDEPTLAWYYDARSIVAATRGQESESIDDTVGQWTHDHEHEHKLHSGEEMILGIRQHFDVVNIERCAYFYRSIGKPMAGEKFTYRLANKVFEIENRKLEENLILPNGLRIVAQLPEA